MSRVGSAMFLFFQDRPKNSSEGTKAKALLSPISCAVSYARQRLFVLRLTTLQYLIPDKHHNVRFRVVLYGFVNTKTEKNWSSNNSTRFMYVA